MAVYGGSKSELTERKCQQWNSKQTMSINLLIDESWSVFKVVTEEKLRDHKSQLKYNSVEQEGLDEWVLFWMSMIVFNLLWRIYNTPLKF